MYLEFVVGLILLIYSSDKFVEYAGRIARALGISLVVFGAIVVAIGTSLPELGITIAAIIDKTPEIIVGNIIGSNIANIGLILGLALVIARVKKPEKEIHRESELLWVISLIFIGLLYLGILNWVYGLFFLIISGFLIYNLMRRKEAQPALHETLAGKNIPLSSVLLVISLVGVLFGSKLTVDTSIELAKSWGVPVKIIALTIIAVGSSLPELMVTLSAIRKKETEIALGNLIGSNLFNITLIGGIGSFFYTLDGKVGFIFGSFFLFFALIAMLLGTGRLKLERKYGISLIAIYALFVISLLVEQNL